ncbi:MAG: rRNA maturation RNase YbeY [Gemmatimonadota bacterium]
MSLRISLSRLDEWAELGCPSDRLEAAAKLALGTVAEPRDAEISITFVEDDEIRRLSREYLGRDVCTDVIAFDLGDESAILGDVYIAPSTARRNAMELGVPPEEELARLVIHGVLHVLGHEHPEGEERYASAMFVLQEELLRRLPAD